MRLVRRSYTVIVSVIAFVAVLSATACGEDAPPAATPTPDAADLRRVLVVHSYDTSFPWTRDLGPGIVEGLAHEGFEEGRNLELRTFYMDTRLTFREPAQITRRAEEAIAMIESFEPEVVFITDDDALREVAVPYTVDNPNLGVSFVFAGINVDPIVYEPITSLERPEAPITGALERIPFLEAFASAKRVFPEAETTVVIADGSASSKVVIDAANADYDTWKEESELEVLAFVQAGTFSEWQRLINEYQDKADVISIINYQQVLDNNGNVVPARDVIGWTIDNSRVPELGLVVALAEDGLFMATGNSGTKTGAYIGAAGGKILKGADAGVMPIVDPARIDTAFNAARAAMLGIAIPDGEREKAVTVHDTIAGR